MRTPDPLTLMQIKKLTGHETTDALRMALRRGGVKSAGIRLSTSWPPSKVYECADVWNLFHARILKQASKDSEVKEACWEHFGSQIREASAAASVGNLFDDKLQ